MNSSHPTAQFLRRHRWRARGTLLVWALAVTLAGAAFAGATYLKWISYGIEWTFLPIALAAGLLVAWFRRARRLTPRQLARELDARWALRSRLETAVELAGENSPLATVQRDDATRQLAGRKPPGAFAWIAGLLAATALLLLLSAEGTAWMIRFLHRPPVKTAATATTDVAATTTPVAPEFHAAIEWKTPESETKATAIEEVPLVAIGDSTTGFRSVTLEMVINGDRELSRPLDESTLAAGTQPGIHEFTPSLYLDELEVKEGDLVSYRLVGELNTPTPQTVVSATQFVEVRRVQKDVALRGGPISAAGARILQLKAAQLALLKQNSLLVQSAGSSPDSTWKTANTATAAAQKALGPQSAELLELARTERVPAPILSQIAELEPLMNEAAGDIMKEANAHALKPQNRALAILTALSQLIVRALSGPSAPVSDPFADQQTFKPVPPDQAARSALEQLAHRQRNNNAQLNGSTGEGRASGGNGSGDSGSMRAEQAAIAKDAELIYASNPTDPQVKAALETGKSAAAEAARQLDQGDTAAAKVPAATAQRAFEEAVAAQERAGRAAAAAEIEQLRRTLNTASRANETERTRQLRQVHDALRAAAQEQQQGGSPEAAGELTRLAEFVTAGQTATKGNPAAPTSAPNSPERAREAAVVAARTQVGLMPRNAALSRAVRLLNRVSQPAAGPAVFSDVEMASQEAQWLTGEVATIELAQQVAGQADTIQRSPGAGRAAPREAIENAVKLAAALEQGRSKRDEFVRRFNPADVDPAYRAAVEAYFERLSREARAAPRTPPQ